jgi:D-serine deaminase-like pyridoxal phosphate-dependent protein
MSGLKYLFQKGNNPDGLQRLTELRAGYKDQSRLGTAESLRQVTEFAARYMEQLKSLGYEEEQLHRSQALPHELRSELARLEEEKQRQAHALQTRNQVIAELDDRVNAARRAFRFVFRRHSDVLDKAKSKYAQKRRQAHAARQQLLKD